MSTIITIKGTNGSGKSSVVRALIANLGKAATLRFNQKEAGYRCRYGDGGLFVLGKYKSACGGLDSSYSYKGAADDVMLCLDILAAKGHVVCEGIIAVNYYGFGRVTRFVDEQKAKGNHVIFARLDTPVELCVKRVQQRRRLRGNYKPFNPDHLLHKHEALLRMQEKLREAGYDARVLPHEDPLQTLLRWLAEQNPAKLVEGELSRFQTSDIKSESIPQPSLNVEVAAVAPPPRTSTCELQCSMDFRKPEYRREVFLRFYEFHLKYGTHPGCVYFVLPFLFKKYSWDVEQRLWFAFLNGNTQNPLTSNVIFDEFPDFAALNLTRLDSWFNANWPVLAFDTDRRHHKKEFIRAVTTYKRLCGDTQAEYFATFMGGDDPYGNFRSAWKEVRDKFHSFGRLSAFSYLEYVRIMRVGKIDCDQLFLDDMQGSKSHRNGLAIVLGRDDLDWHDSNPGFNGEYTPETLQWLKHEGAALLAEAKQRAIGKPWAYDVSYFTLESALCTYKSWHRPKRRYPNVYADMFHDRIKKAERHWPTRDFSEFWAARREYLPEHLRLEDNPADAGVKPIKQNHYRLTGQVVMMSEEWPCFKNDYNDKVNAAQRSATPIQVDRTGDRKDRTTVQVQEQAQGERRAMWHDYIYDLTPVEKIGDIWFKREDKFSPDGMHNGSKFRQLIWLFGRKPYPGVSSGAVSGSPQLPMVAACAEHYVMKCVQFTGAKKDMALAGEKLGAKTKLVNPGYGPLLNRRAKEYAEAHDWLRIETNITVTTSDAEIEAFHRVGSEQVRNLPDHIETLIIPAGSRNSAVSILYGLHRYPPKSLKKIILMHINKNLEKHKNEMWQRLKACGVHKIGYDITTFDVFANGYTTYEKMMPFSLNGLSFHPRYEGKCWNFIKDNLTSFRPYINDRTLFWIVGSEPKSCLA
jgi:Alpha-glutamyl/putrescinyl thymine pyrophosphorylase clade 2